MTDQAPRYQPGTSVDGWFHDLWLHATICGERLGALILWNAWYHNDIVEGRPCRVPEFDQRWAQTKEAYFESRQ